MLIESFLRRLIVIGAHAEDAVNAAEVSCLQFVDDSSGIIAATTHQNGHASTHQVNNQVFDFLFLLLSQRRRLACGSENAEEVGPVVQLILNKTDERLIVDRTVFHERCYQRNTEPFKDIMYHKK